ncbi:glycosyltransferase family protein [Shimia thalassica]|uniref:glycosyltransferase family protein n=1 Tax=Shimia thalassica TaxID=1715693 RepID=UPI0024948489|nr:glycosyltransferase [Shimia thalassica]
MKVLIVVTHLLGTGHLSRGLTLGRACARAGHDVWVMSGGRPAPHMDYTGLQLVQLPSIASDGTNFSRLLQEDSTEVDDAFMQRRIEAAVSSLRDIQPDVIVTELFPFGRRSLSNEFQAILQAAQEMNIRPRIVCSIRDILAPPSKPSKAEKAQALLTEYYDAVLVHSDPGIVALEESWPVTPEVAKLLRYTGFVSPPASSPHPDNVGEGEVLVSAGGGSVGQALFECAVDAARLSDRHWRLLVGGADAAQRIKALQQRAGDLDITIEGVRPDFRQMLHGAAASVSMCGYNTALDLLQTGVPAVLVPFDDGGEVEQTLRAKSLAHQSAMDVLTARDATAEMMAALVEKVIQEGRRHGDDLQMQGADQTVKILENLAGGPA